MFVITVFEDILHFGFLCSIEVYVCARFYDGDLGHEVQFVDSVNLLCHAADIRLCTIDKAYLDGLLPSPDESVFIIGRHAYKIRIDILFFYGW